MSILPSEASEALTRRELLETIIEDAWKAQQRDTKVPSGFVAGQTCSASQRQFESVEMLRFPSGEYPVLGWVPTF